MMGTVGTMPFRSSQPILRRTMTPAFWRLAASRIVTIQMGIISEYTSGRNGLLRDAN